MFDSGMRFGILTCSYAGMVIGSGNTFYSGAGISIG